MAEEKERPLDAKEIHRLYQLGVADVREETAQTWVNRAFVGNRQWIYFDPGTGRVLDSPRRNPSRLRATINKVGPDSERVKAKLLRRPMAFEVLPDRADDEAMEGAKIAEAAIYDHREKNNWEGLRATHISKAWESGTALLCLDWDPTVGTEVAEDGTRTGDAKTTVLDVCQAVAVPGCRDLEHARWWIKAEAVPPSDVKAWYGLDSEPKGNIAGSESPVRRRWGQTDTQQADLCLVLTYYERPNPARPEGAVVTVAGEQVLAEDVWPFPFTDRLNVTVANVIQVDGRWAGMTPLSAACDVQVLRNQAWSSLLEHMRNAGNARMMYPSGAIDDPTMLTDTPGEMFEYRDLGSGSKPEYLSPPQLPQWVIDAPHQLGDEIDDILGVHDVSRGIAPANIESGIGVSILSENDDTPIGALAKTFGEAWGRHATNVLELLAARVKETRTAVVVEGGVPESIEWTGSDFAGQTRVRVPLDSVIPRSRAAQQAFAMQMHDRFADKLDLAKLARIADLPDQDDLIDAVDMDTALARRENRLMAAGRPRMVNEFDDDANHLQILEDFMRTNRFEVLPEEIQDLFTLHRQAHITQMGEKAGKAMAMQVGGMAPQQVGGDVQPSVMPPGMEQAQPGAPDPAGPAQNPTAEEMELGPPLDAQMGMEAPPL